MKLLTGYEAPLRADLFDKLLGNQKIPLMKIEFNEISAPSDDSKDTVLDAIDDMNWRTENSGWRIENTDFVVPFFSGKHGPVTDLPVGTKVVMQKARVTLLGTATVDGQVEIPDGWAEGGEFKSGYGKQFDDLEANAEWDNQALAQYSYGGGRALDQLLGPNGSTIGFSFNGLSVERKNAVSLQSFEDAAKAFDRASQFFRQRHQDLTDWEFDLGSEQAAWKGTAAGVFRDFLHGMNRNYRDYSEQLPTFLNLSKYGTELRGYGDALRDAAQQLYNAWDIWQQFKGNPLRWLHDVLLEVTDWIWYHNLTKVRYVEGDWGWDHKVQYEGFTGGYKDWGPLQEKSTWKKIGEEAIRRWQESVKSDLGKIGQQSIINVQNSWNNADFKAITTVSVDLQSQFQTDDQQRQEEEQKRKEEEAEQKQEEQEKEQEEKEKAAEQKMEEKEQEQERKQEERDKEQEEKEKEQERKQEEKEKEQEAKQEELEKKQEQKEKEQEQKQEEKEKEQEAKQAAQEAKQEQLQKEQEQKQEQKEKEQEAKQAEQERKQEQQQAEQQALQTSMFQQQQKKQEEQERKQEQKEKEQEAKQAEQERKQEEKEKEQEAKQEQLQKEQEAKQAEQERKQEEKEKEQEAKQEQLQKEQEAKQAAQEAKQEQRQEEQEQKQEQLQKEQEAKQAAQEAKQEQRQEEQEQKQEQLQKEQEAKQEELQKKQEQQQAEQEARQERQYREAQQRQDEAEAKYQDQLSQGLPQGISIGTGGSLPDGSSLGDLSSAGDGVSTINPDGSVTTDYPDGSSSTFDPDTGQTIVTSPDGHRDISQLAPGESLHNPDGSWTSRQHDGTLTTDFPDGTSTSVDPHTGEMTTTFPDGTRTTTHLEPGQSYPSLPDNPYDSNLDQRHPTNYEEDLFDGGQLDAGDLASPLYQSQGSSSLTTPNGGMPMLPMGTQINGNTSGGPSTSERIRAVLDDGPQTVTRRRGRAGETEEVGAAGRSGATSSSPFMPPMGGAGGQGGQQETQSSDRERESYLEEDEDVWGADEGGSPASIGRE
ncbi:AAWKG family protein [Streptomyces sp. R1]|nr:AAWKG family protein [Streptomyces sp. R1]